MPLEIHCFTLNGNHDYILTIVVGCLPFLSSFICAKCSETIDCESNLLLLSNGKPVCENCSYSCNVCKQAIKDEAIMTGKKLGNLPKFSCNLYPLSGNEAYHSECFRCVSCKEKIEDLVFTQTSKVEHIINLNI